MKRVVRLSDGVDAQRPGAESEVTRRRTDHEWLVVVGDLGLVDVVVVNRGHRGIVRHEPGHVSKVKSDLDSKGFARVVHEEPIELRLAL